MRRVILLVMTAATFMNIMSVRAFDDISKSMYKTEIDFFEESGIFLGKENGKFYPNDRLTRSEAAKIIYEIVSIDEEIDESTVSYINSRTIFNDVANDFWAHFEIDWLAYDGIIKGYGDGNFYPNEAITGIQLLTMCATVTGYVLFEDESLEWKEKYIKLGKQYGFLNGVTCDVNNTITRAEAAKIIYNAVNLPIVLTMGAEYNLESGLLVPQIVVKDGSDGEEKITLWSIYNQ